MIRVPLSEKLTALIYEDGKVDVVDRAESTPVCTFPLTSAFAMLYHAEEAGIRLRFTINPSEWRGVYGS